MDLYQTNPTALRRLLHKRQNPCTQVFNQQPSMSTSVPMSAMDLTRTGFSTAQEQQQPDFIIEESTSTPISSNMFSQSQIYTQPSQDLSGAQKSVHSPSEMEEDDDDELLSDKVQKKIKTSTNYPQGLKSQRSFDYEEEKEQSEHSTTCEAHSEVNMTSNETGDYLLSPSVECSKESAEVRLDGDSYSPIRSGLVDINLTPEEENSIFGQHQAPGTSNPKTKLKCKLNHTYEVEVGSESKHSCHRCKELLEECRAFAKKNEGSCLNEVYEETIRYRCIQGHCWSLNYKNARRRWCAQCAKEQRNFLKKKCEEEKAEREKQEEECQKKLFEEAKRKAASESGHQPKPSGMNNNNNNAGSHRGMSTLEYFQRIDYEIENLAKKYTISFMSQKEFAGNIHYQQILQVYKIMVMPEEVLQTYMFSLNADTLRSEFRRMAKIIHPDKNKHPQAGNAFQKIYKVYEIALSRFEGAQKI